MTTASTVDLVHGHRVAFVTLLAALHLHNLLALDTATFACAST